MCFQKIPIPHLTCTYYETDIPSLTGISLHVVLTNLVTRILLNIFPEPKVALTKELVYSGLHKDHDL